MTPNKQSTNGAVAFSVLACTITWVLALPTALAWTRQQVPPGYAMACAGLSAFGPLVAAVLVLARRGAVRSMFGPWRTRVGWIVLGLLAPIAVRTAAVGLYALFGGEPSRWFYLPSTSERVAALVLFPIAEEFSWRGFAHPRFVARYGLVRGSVALGLVWGIWHLAYSVTPEAGSFDPLLFGQTLVMLPLYSLVVAWVFERSGRSMAVAIVFHAAGHIQRLESAPKAEMGLQVAHLVVLAITAAVFAHLLSRMQPVESALPADAK